MDEIKVLGNEEIDGQTFVGIEGGFGEGKRSMLVRDIADANGVSVKRLNENIERNRKRFKGGIDIINLKNNSVVAQNDLKKMGFNQQAINRSSNIYLLSERGYAKLLKIMDSDEAWAQYDKFVDGYFQYRKVAREVVPMTPMEMMETQFAILKEVKAENAELKTEFVELKESFGLPNVYAKRFTKSRNRRVIDVMGGYHGQAYNNKKVRGAVYKEMANIIKGHFMVDEYASIPLSRFDEAIQMVEAWTPSEVLQLAIDGSNAQTALEV